MDLLYVSSLYILLIDFVIDMAYYMLLISEYKWFVKMAIKTAKTNIGDWFVIVAIWIGFFLNYFFSFSSPDIVFFLNDFFIGYFSRSFILYSDLLIDKFTSNDNLFSLRYLYIKMLSILATISNMYFLSGLLIVGL